MINVSGKITLLTWLIFSTTSCSSNGYAGKDFTRNYSRIGSPTRAKPVGKAKTYPIKNSSLSMARVAVIEEAKNYLGAPYRYGGKSPSGFDCSGFTQFVYRSQGVQLPSHSKGQAGFGEKITAEQAAPGDLIIFEDRGRIQHVGLIVDVKPGSVKMIHASSSSGVILEDAWASPYWKKRIAYAVRVLKS